MPDLASVEALTRSAATRCRWTHLAPVTCGRLAAGGGGRGIGVVVLPPAHLGFLHVLFLGLRQLGRPPVRDRIFSRGVGRAVFGRFLVQSRFRQGGQLLVGRLLFVERLLQKIGGGLLAERAGEGAGRAVSSDLVVLDLLRRADQCRVLRGRVTG